MIELETQVEGLVAMVDGQKAAAAFSESTQKNNLVAKAQTDNIEATSPKSKELPGGKEVVPDQVIPFDDGFKDF